MTWESNSSAGTGSKPNTVILLSPVKKHNIYQIKHCPCYLVIKDLKLCFNELFVPSHSATY